MIQRLFFLVACSLSFSLPCSAIPESRVEATVRQMADVGPEWELLPSHSEMIYDSTNPTNCTQGHFTFVQHYDDGTTKERQVEIYFDLNEVHLDYVMDTP